MNRSTKKTKLNQTSKYFHMKSFFTNTGMRVNVVETFCVNRIGDKCNWKKMKKKEEKIKSHSHRCLIHWYAIQSFLTWILMLLEIDFLNSNLNVVQLFKLEKDFYSSELMNSILVFSIQLKKKMIFCWPREPFSLRSPKKKE